MVYRPIPMAVTDLPQAPFSLAQNNGGLDVRGNEATPANTTGHLACPLSPNHPLLSELVVLPAHRLNAPCKPPIAGGSSRLACCITTGIP